MGLKAEDLFKGVPRDIFFSTSQITKKKKIEPIALYKTHHMKLSFVAQQMPITAVLDSG